MDLYWEDSGDKKRSEGRVFYEDGTLGPSCVKAACSHTASCLCVFPGVGGMGGGVALLGEHGVA